MEKISLKVNEMTVTYGKFKISNISFELKNGDIMGLVGRSGSGKSTLIKAIIGIKSSSGKVLTTIDEKKGSLSKILGYAPQENALFPFLTLEENLQVFGKLYKMKKNEILEKSKELLKRLDLEKHKKKRITELSGGMQKRADLAVTLLHSPQVIVLDEPFNGLDISLQKFIWDFLKELARNGRITIIYANEPAKSYKTN